MAKNYDARKSFARGPKVCILSEFITTLFFLVRVWATYWQVKRLNYIWILPVLGTFLYGSQTM